ncbi:MAG TPA: hypothetical protein DHW12_07430 [Acinetobacter radioresistens]|nr:hypothetical protein [Acinetobacter radioresistens]
MHFFKYIVLMVFSINASTAVFAQSVELPVLKVMAEPEMRQETGFIPYQERKSEQRALQHRMMQIEDDLQNITVNAHPVRNIEASEGRPEVNMDHLPLALQQHLLAIAAGLQSDNPMRGLEIMLQPFRNELGQIQWDLGKVSLGTLETQALREIDFSQPVTTTPRLRID